jgi:hypothetical protein
MIERGPASEQDMLLAFLRAEVESPRFGEAYRSILARGYLAREHLLDRPDTADPKQNLYRREMLKAIRGYGAGQALFTGFPEDVQWRRVELEPGDFGRVRYARFSTWLDLSGGTRRVIDGAANLDTVTAAENANANVRAVAARLAAGETFPELILVEAAGDTLALVEGHTRATAHVLAGLTSPVSALVGRSPRMSGWAFY